MEAKHEALSDCSERHLSWAAVLNGLGVLTQSRVFQLGDRAPLCLEALAIAGPELERCVRCSLE